MDWPTWKRDVGLVIAVMVAVYLVTKAISG